MILDHRVRALTNPAFRFVVTIDGVPAGAFTECSVPTLEVEVEEIKEGGLNTYVHQLPGRRKAAKVTLKNGVGSVSHLLTWYIKSMNELIERRRVTVTLIDPLFMPVMVWDIEDAYPTRWTGPDLKTDNNTIAIQTLELACGGITVV